MISPGMIMCCSQQVLRPMSVSSLGDFGSCVRRSLFGWKISQCLNHTIGLAASGYLRAQGIPCSLYIADRLNGEILTSTVLPAYRQPEYKFKAALAATFCVLSLLVDLG